MPRHLGSDQPHVERRPQTTRRKNFFHSRELCDSHFALTKSVMEGFHRRFGANDPFEAKTVCNRARRTRDSRQYSFEFDVAYTECPCRPAEANDTQPEIRKLWRPRFVGDGKPHFCRSLCAYPMHAKCGKQTDYAIW